MTDAYESLEARFHRVGLLRSVLGTLSWDGAAIMPAGARRVRGEQLGTIESLIHEIIASSETSDLLEAAQEKTGQFDPWQLANLREMQREYHHATAVPQDLLNALSKAQAVCEGVWIEAKPDNDFARLAPMAQDVLQLKREVARLKAETLDCGAHDALIDEWDPGLRSDQINQVFDELAAKMPPLIEAAMAWQPADMPAMPRIGREQQFAICEEIADMLGYDREHGRISECAQACFMDDSPEDVRIAIDISEEDYRSAAIGISHEIGHSFYERAMPEAYRYQPVARPASAGFQESQSLLFEKIIMRTNVFADRLAGFIDKHAPSTSPRLTSDIVLSQIQHIRPTPIRTDADEATYPLHLVIRFRLEKAMIEGALDFEDLPGAWNDAYREVLNIVPRSDQEGCLQDIHWYRGLYGYFQSYALGSLLSAQLLEAALRDDPSIMPDLENASVLRLRKWLEEKLFRHARLWNADDLIERATGSPLRADAFLRHIRQRYLPPQREETAA